MDNKILAADCVDIVRQRSIRMMAEMKDCDPWDENLDGVYWLDNEMIAFRRMLTYTNGIYKMINITSSIDHSNYFSVDPITNPGACLTVTAAEERLAELSVDLLTALLNFLKLGGTASMLWTDFLNRDREWREAQLAKLTHSA